MPRAAKNVVVRRKLRLEVANHNDIEFNIDADGDLTISDLGQDACIIIPRAGVQTFIDEVQSMQDDE